MSTSTRSTTSPEHAAGSERLGDRFNRKLSEQRLAEAFEAAGVDGPVSIGLLEIDLDALPAAGVAALGSTIAQRIGGQLSARARLVLATASRFVIALPGQPLLEALLSIDRLRDALERETWPVHEHRVSLCFGAGVATRRSAEEPLTETFAAAERSLEQARRLIVRRHEGSAPDAAEGQLYSPLRRAPSPWRSSTLDRPSRRVALRSPPD